MRATLRGDCLFLELMDGDTLTEGAFYAKGHDGLPQRPGSGRDQSQF